MVVKIKTPALFIALLIIFSLNGISSAQWRKECSFKIDTLLYIKYGDSLNMLSKHQLNPCLFCVNNEYTYICQTDDRVLIYDKDGVFKGKKKIPLSDPSFVMEITSYKTGFVISNYFKKIYYVNKSIKIVDSANCLPNCIMGRQFNIYEDINFSNNDNNHQIIQFNIENKSFSIKPYFSVWNTKSVDCTLLPFPDISDSANYAFCGASKKNIIGHRTIITKDTVYNVYTLFNVEKCTATDLINFNYNVNPTTSPRNMFKFVNDSTAIFSVRYYDTYKTCNEPIICPDIFRQFSRKPEPFERDCVFYRITFSGI